MKTILCVSYDKVTNSQRSQIQQYRNEADAKRAWGMAIKQIYDNKNPDNIPIEDLALYKIGELDDETLELKAENKFIANAGEFMA